MQPTCRHAKRDSRRASALVLFCLVFLWSCTTTRPVAVLKDPATRLQEKLEELAENSARSPVPPKNLAFAEDEVNLLVARYLKENAPQAIGEPQVTIQSEARLVARVLVDVDEFKRNRKRNSGPLNFLSGRVPVIVRGEVTGQNGRGQFRLQSAEVNGFTLPRALVLELLANHTRTRDFPQGFDIEKPFELPLKIREMGLRPGEVWVSQ